jgi:hypothetical protein
MVKIKSGKKTWDYPNDVMDTNKINKKIRDDFSEFCKKRDINKGKLVEDFYKSILIKFRDGSLSISSGYLTLNIFKKS